MHPQIHPVQAPGSCPICGMALEPDDAGRRGNTPNPELRRLTRRFWVVAWGYRFPGSWLWQWLGMPSRLRRRSTPPPPTIWLEFLLAPLTPAVLWGGRPFFERGWSSIVSRRLNMFTLIALGTGVAYSYSLVAALAPGIFSAVVSHARKAP